MCPLQRRTRKKEKNQWLGSIYNKLGFCKLLLVASVFAVTEELEDYECFQ